MTVKFGISDKFGPNHVAWAKMLAQHLVKSFARNDVPLHVDLRIFDATECRHLIEQAEMMLIAANNLEKNGWGSLTASDNAKEERARDEEIIRKMFPIYDSNGNLI